MINRYFVHTLENNKTVLVKILNEYETKEEAKKDLFKLSTNGTTEKKILKSYEDKNNF